MKFRLLLITLLASATLADATFIPLGQVNFTGEFTRNGLYDFNNPGAQPYGWFGDQTVVHSGGIFSPYIQPGMVLGGQTLWTTGAVGPIFTIGGFTLINRNGVETIAGQGSFVSSNVVDFSGNGFVPPDGFSVGWFFWAPYEWNATGPITLQFNAGYDNGFVPEGGLTLSMFALGLMGLAGMRKLIS